MPAMITLQRQLQSDTQSVGISTTSTWTGIVLLVVGGLADVVLFTRQWLMGLSISGLPWGPSSSLDRRTPIPSARQCAL
ncbi:hypothetical protein LINGRAHAP2_LOCUS34599 [Linum grandiflorum]